MDTTTLKKFAQGARRQLIEQVSARMEQVLRVDSVEVREKAKVVEQLRAEIEAHGKKAVVDKVAYTWFNRFCALRFMDVNHYTRIGAVSPVEGGTQPEVLLEAKQGHVDEDLARCVNPQVVFDLLSGRRPSSDGQGEAYRLLLVGMCNAYGELMPFLFEKIEDYSELLMPLDLLSENSVLHTLRSALGAEECEDVEVIGWLYQYYISERKDEVFEALKQNQKIEAEDIPAATQLFTPHWIVRYLVENSLGRLWMLNHPNSRLRERMEYYIEPVDGGQLTVDSESPSDHLIVNSPEEIKLLDPACGSGHILTYAFDLLYAIYEEEGYASNDIPRLILERNIFGVEIDGRAGALAAFALTMKARAKDRRFFSRAVLPNICVLENVTFNESELKQYMNAVGRDLFTEPLMETLLQFEQAENFGSLIRPILPTVGDAGYVRGVLAEKNVGGDLFLYGVHERVLKVLKQAEFLAPRYHVVVANPPYMGGANMNDEMKSYAKDLFPDSKSDLFAMFIERNMELVSQGGFAGFMTPFVWMFIASYEKLREQILTKFTVTTLIKPEYNAFWESAHVSICAFILYSKHVKDFQGGYIDLQRFYGAELQPIKALEAIKNPDCGWFYAVSPDEFRKIPGAPIAFWVSEKVRRIYSEATALGDIADIRVGMHTGSNELFVRHWYEVSLSNIGFGCKDEKDTESLPYKWYPYNKGGNFRKWYGNRDFVVNWKQRGIDIHKFHNIPLEHNGAPVRAKTFQFKESLTWSFVTSSYLGVRYSPSGTMFDVGGSSVFPKPDDIYKIIGFLCSTLSTTFIKVVNSTVNYQVGNVATLPIIFPDNDAAIEIPKEIVDVTKNDWNSFETSSDFSSHPILETRFNNPKIKDTYKAVRDYWNETVDRIQQLEVKNNQNFIEAYGLQDEVTPEAPLEVITLTINPSFRYDARKSSEELEALLLADTIKEFISYAVGCMFGRYSLDKPGLVLANAGEGIAEFRMQIAEFQKAEGKKQRLSFEPDVDNAIPVLDGEWFEDDIAERFKKFLRVTFGEEHYEENLAFIEEAIGRDVRSYFVKEFYKDHVQTYKKRPIYWMFSSPKGSFNVLIYMHRYQPDTVSIVLNGYLREYIKKLNAHKSQLERTSVSGSASQSQKTKALKEIQQVNKVLSELKEYEDEVLYPLATQRVSIDLDDGVKVNYGKFGKALAKVKGL